ncbi:hypothetical protein [Celeribacter halophilus]|uniref:Uncharacterized protein n=1 Tax=Celeribacter halophilus TaxID=576117 RepID=A0A1I3X4N8_9RHOB|nr:hypothetical protein [Celeribacter halophilus]PZX03784.1 hypothetical protein LX82_03731 [Celeribacter halophilus]SFK14638.1 hypothetical protein SAMN04488138_1402 [Celeribacter halophilus]
MTESRTDLARALLEMSDNAESKIDADRLERAASLISGDAMHMRDYSRLRDAVREMQGHVFFCQDPDGALRRWYPPEVSK